MPSRTPHRWLMAGGLFAVILLAIASATSTRLQATEIDGSEVPAEPSSPFDAEETDAIKDIIRDYLIENPEVMLEVFESVDSYQTTLEEQRQRDVIAANEDTLFYSPNTFVTGNPDGDITIVEFFDYRCGYCKQAFDRLMNLVEEDGSIRLVLKEFPILGPVSDKASEAAIASIPQGKYMEFHAALMRSKGKLDEQRIYELAESVGIDVDVLKKDMRDPRVAEVIDQGHQLARLVGVEGTPAFVIHDQLYRGALPNERLEEIIEEKRTGCVSC